MQNQNVLRSFLSQKTKGSPLPLPHQFPIASEFNENSTIYQDLIRDEGYLNGLKKKFDAPETISITPETNNAKDENRRYFVKKRYHNRSKNLKNDKLDESSGLQECIDQILKERQKKHTKIKRIDTYKLSNCSKKVTQHNDLILNPM